MIRKKKSKKPFNLPGDILIKHVKYDTPVISGVYACYFKPEEPSSWSGTFPCADMKMISFSNGKFFGNAHVLAWIGPLPVLSLDELEQEQECVNRVFYTGTLKQAAINKFKDGPFSQYMLAFLSPGKKSEFIFEINTHKTVPNPIARYNILKEGWKKIKEKDIKKYIKIMNKFKEK